MKYALTVITALVLSGCMKTADYELPRSPLTAERKPLTVPHRDWLEQGCWFKSENGHDVKVCHENTNSK